MATTTALHQSSTSAPNIEVYDYISNAAPLSFLIDAVEKLLADKSFGPPSHLTVTARHTRNNLLQRKRKL